MPGRNWRRYVGASRSKLEEFAVKLVSAALTATALCLALAACDKPKDRTPKPDDSAPAPTASVSAPLPATPAWAAPYMGKTVAELFPQAGQCVGNTDNVNAKLTGGVEIVGWGWDSAAKKPVANEDIWRELIAAARRHKVQWQWVKGHAGHPENERCDALASEEAKRQADSRSAFKH